MKYFFIFSTCFFIVFLSACEVNQNSEEQIQKSTVSLKFANWNLQTFFDASPDGNEYSGFRKNDTGWTVEKYNDRVQNLCSVIEQIDADIFAVEEIENKNIIYDIINNYKFQGRRDKSYKYACFAGEKNHAFGVGIISRYPIINYTVHQIDIRCENEKQPQTRPVLNAQIIADNKVLSVYICHWKSKSGGQEKTEVWRNYQESQLASLIKNDIYPVFVCGDFNRDLYEFNLSKYDGKISLKSNDYSIRMKSGWFIDGGNGIIFSEGSYFYQNQWEKIDHFFYDEKINIESFDAVKYAGNVTENGSPYRYSVWKGQGFSDHLPIECVIKF